MKSVKTNPLLRETDPVKRQGQLAILDLLDGIRAYTKTVKLRLLNNRQKLEKTLAEYPDYQHEEIEQTLLSIVETGQELRIVRVHAARLDRAFRKGDLYGAILAAYRTGKASLHTGDPAHLATALEIEMDHAAIDDTNEDDDDAKDRRRSRGSELTVQVIHSLADLPLDVFHAGILWGIQNRSEKQIMGQMKVGRTKLHELINQFHAMTGTPRTRRRKK